MFERRGKGDEMMRRSIVIVGLLAIGFLTQGCGTVTGVVSGPLMGGTSLTAKMYKGNASTTTKVIGTPFAFTGGTVVGIFPDMGRGFMQDLSIAGRLSQATDPSRIQPADYSLLFDPFDAGIFR